MSRTLIVVDVQNDFVTGSLGTKEAQAIIPNVQKKIQEYVSRGDQIIFTRDTHFENYLETNEGKHLPVEHCILGTEGWLIVQGLVPEGYPVGYINKETFGYDRWCDKHFSDEIELIGLCTDICVISNALILKAMFPKNTIIVDASCCAGVTPDRHKAALETMKSCQIEVIGE